MFRDERNFLNLLFPLFLTKGKFTLEVATFIRSLLLEGRYFWDLLTTMKFYCLFQKVATF